MPFLWMVPMALWLVTAGGRNNLMFATFLAFFTILLLKDGTRVVQQKVFAVWRLALAGVVLLIFGLGTSLRGAIFTPYGYDHAWYNTLLGGILGHVYAYVAAPIGALDEYIRSAPATFAYGELIMPQVHQLLYLFGLVPSGFGLGGVLPPARYLPIPVNVYTYLRDVIADLGLQSILVIPTLFGVLSEGAYRIVFNNCTLYTWAAINAVVLLAVVFSGYQWLFASTPIWIGLLWAVGVLGLASVRIRFRQGVTELAPTKTVM